MLLSLVIPVYNEQESLADLLSRLEPVLKSVGCDCELLFVDDGSTDETPRLLSQFEKSAIRVRVIRLSRNFGHQAAITAGLDFAEGDAVAIMDADLQDPPELLPKMLSLLTYGYDVVSAQRQARPGDGIWKRSSAAAFYWLMRRFVDQRLAPEVGDFRLFSRKAVLALREFREQHRFMRGLVAWLGLNEVVIPFERGPRAHGVTKYPLWKMLQLAWTAITSFSALPLRLSTTAGVLITLFGVCYLARSMYLSLVTHTALPGWTSLVCLQIIFSGAILLAIGLVGSYVARIYDESKQRPLYVVSNMMNCAAPGAAPRGLVLNGTASAAEAHARAVTIRRAI